MHDVDKYGISKVVEMALNRVNPGGKLPIHLSFDIDALDPFVAPSTVYPVCWTAPSEKYDWYSSPKRRLTEDSRSEMAVIFARHCGRLDCWLRWI
jgi:hypothetical protein